MHQRRTITAAVLFFFFLSGMAGLVYEILWMRMVVAVIGAAPFAVSIVLTIFMGGLGLGAYLASRYVDRIVQPARTLRIYGLLELVIGAYALALPFLIAAFKPAWGVVYNGLFAHFFLYNVLTFLACAVLFGLPVICMGATLPVLVRFYVTSLSHLGQNVGRLYGLNTLGAATGAFLCGFFMVQHLGMWGSFAAAVTANVLIGLACLLIVGRMSVSDAGGPRLPSDGKVRSRGRLPAVAYAALGLFAVSGFCSMASEVIWAKLLGLLIGPTTYSFTIVLVTFIVGLAIGSMLFGRLADRTGRPVELLVVTQVAAALLILGVSQVLGNSQLFWAKLIARYQGDFTMLSMGKAGLLFLFMILPTICLGATFPLVGKIYTQSAARVGRSIGGAYAINTVGAVLGSFLAGFVLLPWLGAQDAVSFVVALQLIGAGGFAVVAVASAASGRRIGVAVVVVGVIGLAAAMRYPVFDQLLLASGKYMRFEQLQVDLGEVGWGEALLKGPGILAEHERSELVYYADGIGGTVAVLRTEDIFGNEEYSLTCSGKPDASSRGDMATQALLAHIPLLFHSAAQSVMVLGLASGVTAGEVLLYPVESVDVLEISREVVEASRYFDEWNGGVLDDPRTNLIVQDGRAHLMLTDRSYDVIISEPSNPWMAGLATLFTREFFAYARDRLNEEGVFAQFLHAYAMDWSTFALVGRTFAEVFPQSALVATTPSGVGADFVLLGFKGDGELNPEVAAANLDYARRSSNVYINGVKQLYPLVIAENLSSVFGFGAINEDDHPRLEFTAPKLMFTTDRRIFSMLESRRRVSETVSRLAETVRTDPEEGLEYVRFALSVNKPFANMIKPSAVDEYQEAEWARLICGYCREYPVNMHVLADGPELGPCRECQIERLRAVVDSTEQVRLAYGYLVKLLFEAGRVEDAAAVAQEWAAVDPTSMEAQVNVGIAEAVQGRCREAAAAFQAALEMDPGNAVAHHNLGRAWLDCREYVAAEEHFREALRIQPGLAEAHCYLGMALLELNQPDSAIERFTRALRLEPSLAAARTGLAKATALRDAD